MCVDAKVDTIKVGGIVKHCRNTQSDGRVAQWTISIIYRLHLSLHSVSAFRIPIAKLYLSTELIDACVFSASAAAGRHDKRRTMQKASDGGAENTSGWNTDTEVQTRASVKEQCG